MTRNLLVKQLRWEADGVLSMTLVDPEYRDLDPWEPGAHLELILPSGDRRHYSLCGPRDDAAQYVVAVLRDAASRGGSRYIHESLRVGSLLEVHGPRNNFRFEPAERVIFIAGGIGITPIVPMLHEARRLGVDWELWYGGRSRSAMAFADAIIASTTEGDRGRIHLFPADHGTLIDLDTALARPSTESAVYCCGPEPLIAAVQERCRDWPAGALRLERFSAPGESPGGPENVSGSPVERFTVRADRSDVEVDVTTGESILEVFEAAGVNVPSSCREGICGSCEVKVLAGRPHHRDLILSEDEREEGHSMMICVSGSETTRLVLDM